MFANLVLPPAAPILSRVESLANLYTNFQSVWSSYLMHRYPNINRYSGVESNSELFTISRAWSYCPFFSLWIKLTTELGVKSRGSSIETCSLKVEEALNERALRFEGDFSWMWGCFNAIIEWSESFSFSNRAWLEMSLEAVISPKSGDRLNPLSDY